MTQIKFGTDGWRGIIADDFTVKNVQRVAQATAFWVNKNFKNASVVIGHDCRFGGELFAETTARVLCANNIKVHLSKGFVSTPMVSLATKKLNAQMGVVITASHNPPSYNGFKLKSFFGGPTPPHQIQEVENLIPESVDAREFLTLQEYQNNGLLDYVDLEEMYCDHIKENFDLEKIKKSGIVLGYDAMYGAGQNVIKKLFPEAVFLHCDYNPSFNGQAPEPIHRNLQEFSLMIKNGRIDLGLATDGDADRIGLYDSKGSFVDAHHIILLLIHYLHQYKKMSGKVVVAFSTSMKIKKLCERYNLFYEVTKIGFKYIAEIMTQQDVLIGGEESGGIAVKGHIPERDGIWDGLIILQYMTETGKTLEQLIKEIYDEVGSFAYDRYDLHLDEKLKQQIVANCKEGRYYSFGKYKVARVENIDGYKFYLGNDVSLMIRPSGTEPLLRVYAEANNRNEVIELLETAKKILLDVKS